MASRKKTKQIGKKLGERVRRGRGEATRLDPTLEELARGDATRAPRARSPRRPRLRDPRAAALVPGVSNRDARRVFEGRLAALQAADGETRGRLLAEAIALRLWRCRRLTGLDALVQDLLQWDPEEARQASHEAADRFDLPTDLTDEAIASWMRVEAALLEQEISTVRAYVRGRSDPRLVLELPANEASVPLHAIGRRQAELSRDVTGEPPPPRRTPPER